MLAASQPARTSQPAPAGTNQPAPAGTNQPEPAGTNQPEPAPAVSRGGLRTVMPSVPRAFCLMAMAMRFFSARVSRRAASIFRLTLACSRSASSRFSASVPMPSSLDTCSNLWRLVMESVPISAWRGETRAWERVYRVFSAIEP